MKFYKPKFWEKKNSLLSIFFLPFSYFYIFLLILKKKLSEKKKHKIPIICVGNLYIGGTGKTPLAIKVVKIIKTRIKKVALIKKFYKNHVDEIKLIQSKQIKFFNNQTRNLSIYSAVRKGFKTAVLDDGLQDESFYKDISIVCFNHNQLIGNGRVIPAGPLREPIQNLRKAQIVVINGKRNINFEKKIFKISKSIKIFYSSYKPLNISDFKNFKLLAFAGIGNPNNFFFLLKKYKLHVKKTISFPDHYNYSFQEIKNIILEAKRKKLKIITTEKDYHRLKHFKLSNIYYLKIKLDIKDENKFTKNILKYIQ